MQSIIIYSTKHGTVEKAVNKLKQEMEGTVDSFHLKKEAIPSLEKYDVVILGGSIYMGKIQKEMSQYMKDHLELLLKKRVGLFLCAGQPNTEELLKEWEKAFPAELSKHALAKETFGYEFDFMKMNFFEKLIVRKVQGIKESRFALSQKKIAQFAGKLI
ncbi:flavodoxin domain-containing protein [Niallia sp. 03133]|uniref:flavodoxin domain-containing protein n=1 Tax=Niallia sp. 03133 TaxID=3458060 RepID=UPI004044A8E0